MARTKTETETYIADWSNYNTEYSTSLYARKYTLYRREGSQGTQYVLKFLGGAAMANQQNRFLAREEAINWIATEATDTHDRGYTREQAEIMIDGGDAGDGLRSSVCDEKEDRHPGKDARFDA